ncbi:MAG TPA: nucleoside transporter C-terminal domain-containing protein [Candidatus Limnocylindrales bacterium]|nr:nucleoside transporter C-terminal domain-containing protein [Candidatus Limnocylindrales bacterium]
MHRHWTGLLGMAAILGLAYLFSTNRRAIRMKTVIWGLVLQISFAFIVLDTRIGRATFGVIGDAVNKLLDYSFYGSTFIFGSLGQKNSPMGFYFAFQVLPTIIFIAALFALLYYYGVMPFIVKQAAKVMTKLMAASGAESLNIAASIFMGQTEAPLTIRPYLPETTRSELMCIMTSGMAHVSGGIMAAYIAFGVDAKHLITAVIMTAPGTLLLSKMLVPETEKPVTAGRVEMANLEKDPNALGALSRGTIDGLHLALNVAAMLISFIAIIYLCDGILGGLHNWLAPHGFAYFPSSLEQIFGWLLAPVAWLIGVPWRDAGNVGSLLGTRMVLNELIAYGRLGPMRGVLQPRSFTIATYALCGFANFSSIGIQIGGIGALAPNKRDELARLGIRAMLAGTAANLMSAAIVGIMLK